MVNVSEKNTQNQKWMIHGSKNMADDSSIFNEHSLSVRRGITHIVTFVNENKEEIETRHDGCRHSDILTKGPRSIVSATDRVGSRQDRCARIQGCFDACLGDRDCLLFHGFVNGNLVTHVHLVELVDAADTL